MTWLEIDSQYLLNVDIIGIVSYFLYCYVFCTVAQMGSYKVFFFFAGEGSNLLKSYINNINNIFSPK